MTSPSRKPAVAAGSALAAALLGVAWQVRVLGRQGDSGSARLGLLALGLLVAGTAAASLRRPARVGLPRAAALALGSALSLWAAVLERAVLVGFPDALDLFLMLFAGTLQAALILAGLTAGRAGAARATRRGAVAAAALAASLSLVEAAHRPFVRVASNDLHPDDPAVPHCLVRGPDGRTRASAGFRGHYEHPEFDGVVVEINAWGLRDGLDEAVPPAPGERSVLVVGDSFTFGLGVPLEDTYPQRIQTGWRPGDGEAPRLRVYGAGIPGYSPAEARAMFEDLAPRTRPDVVVLGLFEGNDFQDQYSWERREEARGKGPAGPVQGPLRRYLDTARRFPFWASSCSIVRAYRDVLEPALVGLGWIHPLLNTNLFLDQALRAEPTELVVAMREGLLDELELLRREVEAAGAELLVLVIPAPVQAEPRRFEDFVALHPGGGDGGFDRLAFHAGLVARLRERGFRVVDTLEALETSAASGSSGYFAEGHWNPLGHALGAEALGPAVYDLLRKP